jgi:hypothetical protein
MDSSWEAKPELGAIMDKTEIIAVATTAAILVGNGKTSWRFKYGLLLSVAGGELARAMAGAEDQPSPAGRGWPATALSPAAAGRVRGFFSVPTSMSS